MDDKDWEEKEEFWDNDIEEDDEDESNGLDINIDANNDETFGNSAEWNEDEHEELIARDLILSNTRQRGNRHNNNSNINNDHKASSNNLRSDRHDQINNSNARASAINNNRNNSGRAAQHFALFAQALGPTPGQPTGWNLDKAPDEEDILAQMRQRSMQGQPRSSTNNELSWQDSLGATQRMQLLQLQQQAQEQLRLLSQSRLLIDQEQARLQQLNEQNRLFQPNQQRPAGPDLMFAQPDPTMLHAASSTMQKPVSQPKVLTVDELERQLMKTSINQSPQQPPRGSSTTAPEPSRRAGWSPFGSKDLFVNDDPSLVSGGLFNPNLLQNIQPQNLTVEQQRLILEQQKLLQQQQQLQQLALFKQQQQHQQQQHQRQQHQLNHQRQVHQQQQLQHQQQNTDPKLMFSSAQCFTVEELERQMLANRANKTQGPEKKKRVVPEAQCKVTRPDSAPRQQSNENRHRNFPDRRNGERNDRFERHNNHRDFDDSREDHRDRENKNHRDHFRHHKKEPTIIPPQVQLGVIERAKRMHSITAMHSDEFLQDRMPTNSDGFRFIRHSKVSDVKANHDGVLTDKERDWLTRIQEKIQADYDDNIDQDYYYLLYFNRSSITDEAAQKPSGPGVFDRRFIPRERLLYNSGV